MAAIPWTKISDGVGEVGRTADHCRFPTIGYHRSPSVDSYSRFLSKYLISFLNRPPDPSLLLPLLSGRCATDFRSNRVLQITCELAIYLALPTTPCSFTRLHRHRAHHDFQTPTNLSTPLRSYNHVGRSVLIRYLSHHDSIRPAELWQDVPLAPPDRCVVSIRPFSYTKPSSWWIAFSSCQLRTTPIHTRKRSTSAWEPIGITMGSPGYSPLLKRCVS